MRRTHSPEFKAKVALAALQGEYTMAQLVKKFVPNSPEVYRSYDMETEIASNLALS